MSTQDNLQEAFAGESQANRKYLAFAKKAEDEGLSQVAKLFRAAEAETEGNKPAAFSFKNALAVEEIHHNLYVEALEAVKGGSDLPTAKLYVCPVCGNTVKDHVPETCPICNAAGGTFFEIE
jgi:rubrerythrin